MDNFGNDVAQKMKSALKAKLIELDAYVDDELPEYIMVMVANKKSKAQMAEDLSLFLGDNTEHFTDWLHDVLNRLQAVAIGRIDSRSQKSEKDRHGEGRRSPKTERKPSASELSVVGASERRSSGSRSSRDGSSDVAASLVVPKSEKKQEIVEEVDEGVEEEAEGTPDEDKDEETELAPAEDSAEEKDVAAEEDVIEEEDKQEGDEAENEAAGDTDPQYEFLAIKAEQESDDLLGEELKDHPPTLPPPVQPPPPPTGPPAKRKKTEPPPPLPPPPVRRSAFGHKMTSSSSTTVPPSSPSSRQQRPAPRAVRVGSDPSYIPISLTSASSKSRPVETGAETGRAAQSSTSRRVSSDRSTLPTGLKRRAPSSAVGAVVRRQFPQQEEEGPDDRYDPRHPVVGSVASTVQVSQRRSSLPVNRQANTALLLKAVSEAQKSILQSTQRATCLPVRESSPPKLFTRGYLQRQQQEDTKFQSSKYIAEKFLPRFTIKRAKEDMNLRVSVVTRGPKPSPTPATTKPVETVEMADSTEHLSEDDEEETGDAEEVEEEEATPRDSPAENELVEEVEEEEEAGIEEEEEKQDVVLPETTKNVAQRAPADVRPPPPTSPKFFITLDGVGSTLFGSRLKNKPLWEEEEMDTTRSMPPPPPYVAPPTGAAAATAAAHRGIRWELRGRSGSADDMLEVDDQQVAVPENLDGVQFVVVNRCADLPAEDMDTFNPNDNSDWAAEAMDHQPSFKTAPLKKFEERCRFWPTCKNGDGCEYHHPTITCKAFPSCKYGSHCRYIHPNCRFDGSCSKRECPYTHVVPRSAPPSVEILTVPFTSTPVRRPLKPRSVPPSLPISAIPSKIRCRNYPKCSNVDCTFYHPKPCRYASRCTRPDCTFFHPDAPTRDKMKWSKIQIKETAKPTHISERPFAVEQARQKINVTTVTTVGQ